MKRLFILVILFTLILNISIFKSSAIEYDFVIEDNNDLIDKELSRLFDGLPSEIRDKLSHVSESEADKILKKYSFNYFWDIIREEFSEVLPNNLNLLSRIIAIIILVALFKNFQNTIECPTLSPSMDMCFSLVTVLSIGTIQMNVFSMTEHFLKTLSSTMQLIVPVMEAIYISLGNYSQAAISMTGINLMISFTESIFANSIYPAIVVSFLISTLSCVTQNNALIHISKILRTTITTVIILIMTLMTFALTLQLSTGVVADNFRNRTVRFALGSYIPIVGGAVSETFSILQGSLSLIKSLSGTTAIVIILLLSIGPLISLVISKLAINIAANLAGALNCHREECLLQEISSCYILSISVVLSSSLMYIIALAQFCKSATMVN